MTDSNSAPRDTPGSPVVARLYLAMLAGSDRTGYLEGRWRKPQGGGMGQTFIRTDRLGQLAEMATAMRSRTDFYVGCAPRTHRHGGAEAVAFVYALWSDLDGPEAVAALEGFTPAPTLVIASGTGENLHAYWQLNRPLPADQGRRALRRLAHALSADMRSTDPARILRPPGTGNFKTDPPAAVECIRLGVTAHDARAIVGHLPDPPDTRGRQGRVSGTVRPLSAVPDPLADIAPADYVEALTGLVPDRDGKVCCPLPGHEDATPSMHVYPDPDRGWWCFGCERGGGVYQLAAILGGFPLPLRGEDFIAVRDVLLDHLTTAKAA